MAPPAFEEQLTCDIQELRNHFYLPVEILVTRWGEPSDAWVSWDVDLIVRPEMMDDATLELYEQLGTLLKHDPYRIMEEGIATNLIGYMVTNKASAC